MNTHRSWALPCRDFSSYNGYLRIKAWAAWQGSQIKPRKLCSQWDHWFVSQLWTRQDGFPSGPQFPHLPKRETKPYQRFPNACRSIQEDDDKSFIFKFFFNWSITYDKVHVKECTACWIFTRWTDECNTTWIKKQNVTSTLETCPSSLPSRLSPSPSWW